MKNSFLTCFFILSCSFLLVNTLIPFIIKLAFRKKWIKHPNHRTIHNGDIPWGGGIAIYVSFVISMVLGALLFTKNPGAGLFIPDFLKFMFPATLIFIVGFIDDLKELKARYKLLAQIGSGLILFFLGIKITIFINPLTGGLFLLHPTLSCILTVFWVVLITNAINLIDGLDGLASGIIIISSLVLFLTNRLITNSIINFVYMGIIGSTAGFLRYNFYPAKIFMGDSGSLFLGFLLAAVSILAHQKNTLPCSLLVPLTVMGIPLIDTGWTIIRRIFTHQGIFTPDKNHIHHRLLKAGFSQWKTAIVLWVYTLILGGISLLIF